MYLFNKECEDGEKRTREVVISDDCKKITTKAIAEECVDGKWQFRTSAEDGTETRRKIPGLSQPLETCTEYVTVAQSYDGDVAIYKKLHWDGKRFVPKKWCNGEEKIEVKKGTKLPEKPKDCDSYILVKHTFCHCEKGEW